MKNLIKIEVEKLIKKYNTFNPFEIASAENIIIITEPLGGICGYYNKIYRQKSIHINCNLSESRQLLTCAHELGHAKLHANANTPFLKSNTFYSVSKLERQANLFAAHLLISDDLINDYEGYNLEQISILENLPLELLKLKFDLI